VRKRDPRHRYLDLKNRKVLPDTIFERAIYVLLHGKKVFDADIPHNPWDDSQELEPDAVYSWEVFNNLGLRSIFESFLFSTDNDRLVEDSLGVSATTVGIYREIFFDTTVFKNDLERIAWLQTVPDEDVAKEAYKTAFHQGFAALRWHYCRDKGRVSLEEAEYTVLTDSYVQYLSHRGKSLTGRTAREARNLSKVVLESIKTIRSKSDLGDNESAESLRFKFKETRKTATIDELNAEGIEVMH